MSMVQQHKVFDFVQGSTPGGLLHLEPGSIGPLVTAFHELILDVTLSFLFTFHWTISHTSAHQQGS